MKKKISQISYINLSDKMKNISFSFFFLKNSNLKNKIKNKLVEIRKKKPTKVSRQFKSKSFL